MHEIADLRRRISYDSATGEFRWIYTGSKINFEGRLAGTIDKQGYRIICVEGRLYRGARLAWALVHGEWPSGEVDHINRCPGDDRIANLRVVTKAQNQINSRARRSVSGLRGVGFIARTGKYQARTKIGGKSVHLGYFDKAEDAHATYISFVEKHHGISVQHERAGRLPALA